jgi:hypothetical protein
MPSPIPNCTSLRRSDGQTGHQHWLKSESDTIFSPSKCPQHLYRGSCHCEAITYEFKSISAVDSDATFYTCDCNACFKRGYLFFVIPIKHFKFTSRSASDLGTYATTTGCCSNMRAVAHCREFLALLLSSLWCATVGRV